MNLSFRISVQIFRVHVCSKRQFWEVLRLGMCWCLVSWLRCGRTVGMKDEAVFKITEGFSHSVDDGRSCTTLLANAAVIICQSRACRCICCALLYSCYLLLLVVAAMTVSLLPQYLFSIQ